VQSPKKTVTVRDALRTKAVLAIEPQSKTAVNQQAVDEARKPLGSRRKNLAELQAKATELYGIPAAGLAAIPTIESGFRFSPLESDSDFNYFQPERLIDEAAGILERCAQARARHHQLRMDKWKLQIELDRFFRLDQIQERERLAGLDSLPYERAALESSAENSLETCHASAEAELKDLTEDLLASGFNKRMAARELSAWLAAYPLKDSDLRGDDANYIFDGVSRNKPNHLFEAARLEADQAAWEQMSDLMARRYSAMASSEAGKSRKESLNVQMRLALAQIGFRRESAQAERDGFWEKVFQTQIPAGLFNYTEQMAALERSFSFDFREALARLTAAQRGLKELYDYAPPVPTEGAPGYFDDVAAWARRTQDRLAQASQVDQDYLLAVSVKELAKSEWESGRAASQWTFEVPEDLFKGQSHVRVRGLGLAVAGEPEPAEPPPQKSKNAPPPPPPAKPLGYWSASLSVPPSATVRYASGTTGQVNQASLPECYLGRVADRDAAREPEIGGMNALHNASPIGPKWKLTLSSKSTDGTPTANLHDVLLYLHVAVRSRKARS
jgi:hypothetical protein